jgi:hypothetical protein
MNRQDGTQRSADVGFGHTAHLHVLEAHSCEGPHDDHLTCRLPRK